jgi:3-isopropylmalate dehydratase small subunit
MAPRSREPAPFASHPAPEWDDPLPTVAGRAWAFGVELSAENVLPRRFAHLPPNEARRHVFADIDTGLAVALTEGDIVVADEQHGDEDASAALMALRAAGVVARVARRFDPALERAALDAGIVPTTVDAPAFIRTRDRVRIDLEAAKVVNLSSGDRAAIRNLDERRRSALRAILRPPSRDGGAGRA